LGPRGPSRAPALALPESSSACLLLRRMAWSSRCSRIPKPETKGGPGDEDAFEDGLGNRNARLEEGTGLTTVPLEIRVTALRVRNRPRRSGVHGRNGPQWRTRQWGSRRKLSRVLDLWHRHFCSSSLRKKAVVFGRGRYGEAKRGKRSGGASGHASVRGGLKARTPFLRAGTHGSRSVLGITSTPSRGLSRLSRERIPTL
jgi:hypothetical protein